MALKFLRTTTSDAQANRRRNRSLEAEPGTREMRRDADNRHYVNPGPKPSATHSTAA